METLPRLKTLTKSVATTKRFALCVDNSEYPVALELHKVYAVLPDARAAEDDFLRVGRGLSLRRQALRVG